MKRREIRINGDFAFLFFIFYFFIDFLIDFFIFFQKLNENVEEDGEILDLGFGLL